MGIFKKQNLDFNNQPWVFRPARVKMWRDFVGEYKGNILVCGLGDFELEMAPNSRFCTTNGDYNYPHWLPETGNLSQYEVVFCFEVLEHLCNPLLFLERLREFITNDCDVYISFPSGRPQFLWTAGHFHEYGKARAEMLFKMAGYQIIRSGKTGIIWKKWYEYFRGVRPLLRLFWPLRCRLYHLRVMRDA
jgi:hypothetical protein